MAPAPRQRFNERRSDQRYAVKAAIEYKVLLRNGRVLTGVGQTVNMSSGGVLVEAASSLPRGAEIELSIAWPVSLNNVVPLKLHITGQTVRTHRNRTAVTIRRYEFRTRGKLSSDRESRMILCAED